MSWLSARRLGAVRGGAGASSHRAEEAGLPCARPLTEGQCERIR